MKTAKRQRLMVEKANRRPLHLGPPLDEVDPRIAGEWMWATHRTCGGPGEINRYWRIAVCHGCGHAVPCAEMAG